MKKILLLISIVTVLASCSTPVEQAIAVNENAAEEFNSVDSYKALGEALKNYASAADEFVKDNEDFEPTDEEEDKIIESEHKLRHAIDKSRKTLREKYGNLYDKNKDLESQKPAVEDATAFMSEVAKLEKEYPDASDFHKFKARSKDVIEICERFLKFNDLEY